MGKKLVQWVKYVSVSKKYDVGVSDIYGGQLSTGGIYAQRVKEKWKVYKNIIIFLYISNVVIRKEKFKQRSRTK